MTTPTPWLPQNQAPIPPDVPTVPTQRSTAVVVMRVLATPITWVGALFLLCLSTIPAILVEDTSSTLANWLPLAVFAVIMLATLVVLQLTLRRVMLKEWLPYDTPLWLFTVCFIIPLGEELDLGGGAAAGLTLIGLLLAAGLTVRLIVFHMRQYRAGR